MPSYTINGKDYFFTKDIGQDRAEEIIAEREGLTSEVEEGTTEAAGTYQDPKYEGFFTEAGEGVVSGGIGIIQGLAETVSLIPDLTLFTPIFGVPLVILATRPALLTMLAAVIPGIPN